jgi:hypothetical protein
MLIPQKTYQVFGANLRTADGIKILHFAANFQTIVAKALLFIEKSATFWFSNFVYVLRVCVLQVQTSFSLLFVMLWILTFASLSWQS